MKTFSETCTILIMVGTAFINPSDGTHTSCNKELTIPTFSPCGHVKDGRGELVQTIQVLVPISSYMTSRCGGGRRMFGVEWGHRICRFKGKSEENTTMQMTSTDSSSAESVTFVVGSTTAETTPATSNILDTDKPQTKSSNVTEFTSGKDVASATPLPNSAQATSRSVSSTHSKMISSAANKITGDFATTEISTPTPTSQQQIPKSTGPKLTGADTSQTPDGFTTNGTPIITTEKPSTTATDTPVTAQTTALTSETATDAPIMTVTAQTPTTVSNQISSVITTEESLSTTTEASTALATTTIPTVLTTPTHKTTTTTTKSESLTTVTTPTQIATTTTEPSITPVTTPIPTADTNPTTATAATTTTTKPPTIVTTPTQIATTTTESPTAPVTTPIPTADTNPTTATAATTTTTKPPTIVTTPTQIATTTTESPTAPVTTPIPTADTSPTRATTTKPPTTVTTPTHIATTTTVSPTTPVTTPIPTAATSPTTPTTPTTMTGTTQITTVGSTEMKCATVHDNCKVFVTDHQDKRILWADLHGLQRLKFSVFKTLSGKPSDVNFDTVEQKLYWSDNDNKRIWRADPLPDSIPEHVTMENTDDKPLGIVIAEQARYLYCTYESKGWIHRVTLGDPNSETPFEENIDKARALAIDEVNGYLYWSRHEGIDRKRLDGSGSKQVVLALPEFSKLFGLTINTEGSRLFFCDENSKKALYVDLWTSDPPVLLIGSQHSMVLRDVSMDGNGVLYWLQSGYKRIVVMVDYLTSTELLFDALDAFVNPQRMHIARIA
ncbi:mucin-2-like [Lytechinus variegatus]|uniref:mucin-2-like n=1 Tax=Lytechinus variegatus TaxID=7654 RepID=UPI001BB2B3BE|nr:mucin-2-like [Lytechinus variegatus]